MRSTHVAISLIVLCASGCAARTPGPQTTPPTTVTPPAAAVSPPSPAAAAHEPGPVVTEYQPAKPLSRRDTVLLFKKRNTTAIREALARVGIQYLTHGAEGAPAAAPAEGPALAPPEASTARGTAPMTARAAFAALRDAVDDCPERFAADLRNAWHEFNGEWYFVDAQGRPAQAYSELPPIANEERNTACQGKVGKWGDASGTGDYDGGHMLGSQLGGYGKRLNMVPQIANFNRGNWVQLENKAARCTTLQPGRLVYWVGVEYPDATELIPNMMSLYLEDTQTGDAIEVTFQNRPGGGPNGLAERQRGVQFLSQLGCQ